MRNSALLFSLFFLSACATYHLKVGGARQKLADGEPQAAVEMLAEKARGGGKDQVLYMLDYALALHEAGDLKNSNKAFIRVDRLADTKDYISLTTETATLFANESLKQYKSERFENLLINVYLALNFALLGDYEGALVECRRIDEKLYKFRLNKEDKSKNFFARYLAAMLWEEDKKFDSAYIDYNNAYNIRPGTPYLGQDLIRAAWRSRRNDQVKKWQKKFPDVDLKQLKKDVRTKGELVFVYQQGWVPRKKARPDNYRFPHMVRVPSGFKEAILEVDGKRLPGTTSLFYDVGDEAIRNLREDYDYLVAKKLLGIIAKEVVADQVRQKDETLGALVGLAMHLADQADIRQWSTLPDSIQLYKAFLTPGEHQLKVYARGGAGETLIFEGPVKIQKGKKTFITERTFY